MKETWQGKEDDDMHSYSSSFINSQLSADMWELWRIIWRFFTDFSSSVDGNFFFLPHSNIQRLWQRNWFVFTISIISSSFTTHTPPDFHPCSFPASKFELLRFSAETTGLQNVFWSVEAVLSYIKFGFCHVLLNTSVIHFPRHSLKFSRRKLSSVKKNKLLLLCAA